MQHTTRMSQYLSRFTPCLLLLVLLLGGCGLGRTQPSTFHVLNTGLEPAAAVTRITGPRVAVGPVTLPAYLDRNPIFVRQADNPAATEVQIHEFALWSEPLTDGVARVICETLSRHLGPADGMAFPLHAAIPPTWRLTIDVARLDGAPNSSITLEAGWTLSTALGDVFAMGRFVQSAPCGPELADMIRAQSLLLNQFGEALSTEILAAER